MYEGMYVSHTMTKLIIVGPQCSGKTAIARKLRQYDLAIPIIEEDDELNRLNGGESPSDWTDWSYKWETLRPRVQKSIIDMESVVFFTSFFDLELLAKAKQEGFKLFQLVTDEEELKKRNTRRMERGVDDATYGWKLNLPYHEELQRNGLIDLAISTDKPVEELAELICIILMAYETPGYAPRSQKESLA
jgi:hypothetical protein